MSKEELNKKILHLKKLKIAALLSKSPELEKIEKELAEAAKQASVADAARAEAEDQARASDARAEAEDQARSSDARAEAEDQARSSDARASDARAEVEDQARVLGARAAEEAKAEELKADAAREEKKEKLNKQKEKVIRFARDKVYKDINLKINDIFKDKDNIIKWATIINVFNPGLIKSDEPNYSIGEKVMQLLQNKNNNLPLEGNIGLGEANWLTRYALIEQLNDKIDVNEWNKTFPGNIITEEDANEIADLKITIQTSILNTISNVRDFTHKKNVSNYFDNISKSLLAVAVAFTITGGICTAGLVAVAASSVCAVAYMWYRSKSHNAEKKFNAEITVENQSFKNNKLFNLTNPLFHPSDKYDIERTKVTSKQDPIDRKDVLYNFIAIIDDLLPESTEQYPEMRQEIHSVARNLSEVIPQKVQDNNKTVKFPSFGKLSSFKQK